MAPDSSCIRSKHPPTQPHRYLIMLPLHAHKHVSLACLSAHMVTKPVHITHSHTTQPPPNTTAHYNHGGREREGVNWRIGMWWEIHLFVHKGTQHSSAPRLWVNHIQTRFTFHSNVALYESNTSPTPYGGRWITTYTTSQGIWSRPPCLLGKPG